MEGVGARLGRSSTRYGPTTAFTGPVRKWKKTWVPLSTPPSTVTNASAGGGTNSPSNLLVYKWAPLNGSASNGEEKDQPQVKRKKYRHIPIYEEDQKTENDVKSEDENSKDEDDKPNTDEISMEEAQASDKGESGGNGTDLNLNLGLDDDGEE